MATGLTTALGSLVDSLNVNQSRLSYISENIANVNTVGYTRKTVAQETKVSGGVANGVNLTEVRRSVDEFLSTASRRQVSLVSASKTKLDYFDRIQKFTLGNPNSAFTVNNTVNDFFSNLENYANDPSSAVKRSLVVTSATNFTDTLNNLSSNLQEERFNADTDLSTSINDLNDALSNLFDLNGAIRLNSQAQGDVQRLLDARDLQIKKVKELVDANVSFNEFGQASIVLNNNEILGINQKYQLSYTRLASVNNLVNNTEIGPIQVTAYDTSGNPTGNVETILSGSNEEPKINNISGGKLRSLIDLRDSDIPRILDQLDNLAYTFANQFNEVHNGGTGFPPPSSIIGANSFALNDEYSFTGSFRITLTDANGKPIESRYGGSLLPLEVDLSEFNGGNGKGSATVQSIINEINSYYGAQAPQVANIGSAYDIRLASESEVVATTKATGSISFSSQPANNNTILINGVQYTFKTSASAATDIQIGGSIAETVDNLASVLNGSTNSSVRLATYTSTGSILSVSYDLGGVDGNSFTLSAAGTPAASASGATLSGGANTTGNFNFDFDLSNLSPDGEDITFDVNSISINSGASSSVTFDPQTLTAGQRRRTDTNSGANDSLSVDLGALNLQQGDTFTITANVTVTENGVTKNEDITYTITIPDRLDNVNNQRYAVTSIGTGDGEVIESTSNNGYLSASLVNSSGSNIAEDDVEGFLKLKSANPDIRIVFDQLDSKEVGEYGAADPASTATNYGLSHFFGLNNFFVFDGKKTNSALNLSVRSDIISSPQLLSGGRAQRSTQTGTDAVYSYEIGSGSNSAILDMISLQEQNLTFAASGSLPELFTTINSYSTEIYSSASLQYNNADSEYQKQSLLNEAINKKIDDISGVNVDEELADTISVQNAYSASAKIISTVKEMLDELRSTLTN